MKGHDLTDKTMPQKILPIEAVGLSRQYRNENGIDFGTTMNKLRKLIYKCTWRAQFLYDKKYHRQRIRVAVGSTSGAVFADMFLAMI